MKKDIILSKRYEPEDGLDFYPTPPWATRSFMDIFSQQSGLNWHDLTIWEPSVGSGHMSSVFDEFGVRKVVKSDIKNYGLNDFDMDFMNEEYKEDFDAIVTNPPFNIADRYIRRSLELYDDRVKFQAFLVRLAFLEGVWRYENIYSKYKPYIWVFCNRLTMSKEKLMRNGSGIAFMWLVFLGEKYDGKSLEQINFIPNYMKKQYELEEDYENYNQEWR